MPQIFVDNFVTLRRFSTAILTSAGYKIFGLEPGIKKLIVIAGPTAVGKTAVAIKLAKHFNTEIVSADSRQFFRELNIGTAKPTEAQLKEIPHHFINTLSIAQEYDAAQFGRDALQTIERIFQQHQYAILCGGSGLYIKAAVDGFDDIPEVPNDIRKELTDQFAENGIAWLYDRLRSLDPAALEKLDPKNPHRLIRALEVRIATGQSIFDFRKNQRLQHNFQVVKTGLELPREELYKRIDERMDEMIEAGLFDEAEQLYTFKEHHALQTVGYQEIFGYLDGEYDKDEAVRLLKRNSRRYAKRQMTWFRRDPETSWFHPGETDAIINHIKSFEQSS